MLFLATSRRTQVDTVENWIQSASRRLRAASLSAAGLLATLPGGAPHVVCAASGCAAAPGGRAGGKSAGAGGANRGANNGCCWCWCDLRRASGGGVEPAAKDATRALDRDERWTVRSERNASGGDPVYLCVSLIPVVPSRAFAGLAVRSSWRRKRPVGPGVDDEIVSTRSLREGSREPGGAACLPVARHAR